MCQVKKDIYDIKLKLSEAEIKPLSNYQFEVIVIQKIETLAIAHLLSKRKHKSITPNITTFNPKVYPLPINLSIAEVKKVSENFEKINSYISATHLWLLILCTFKEGKYEKGPFIPSLKK